MSIGSIETRCAFLGDPVAADGLRLTLNRALREVLPHLLSEAADPVLKEAEGVIRIRRLQLRIDLSARLDLRDLARLIAVRIVAALRGLIQRHSTDIATWPDEASYTAAYVRHRLGIETAPDWAFPDFAALRYLSAPEAAVEVLAQRPDAVRSMSDSSTADGIEAIASCLALSDQYALLKRMTEHHPVQPRMGDILQKAVSFLQGGRWTNLDTVPAQKRPFIYLATVLKSEASIRDAAILATLFDCIATHRDPLDAASIARASDDPIDALLSRMARRLSLPQISQAARDAEVRRSIELLISEIDVQSHRTAQGPSRRRGTPAEKQPASCHSQFAGCALLLPSISRLGLLRALEPQSVTDALIALFPDEDHAALQRDPLVAQIAEIESIKAENKLSSLISGPHCQQLQNTCAQLFAGDIPEISALLLADFAAQLPGLQASSRAYLVREFLARPGRVERTKKSLTIDLTDMPLGVVLQMGGHLGHRGPAWPEGPELTILLKGRTT
ncbi:MAG: hypothetical protein AAGK92_00850 [Pseudomonadota bacterium]